MKTYKIITLDELIEQLAAIGDGPVRGLDGFIHSDRKVYDRNATAPGGPELTGSELARRYDSERGRTMEGFRGGPYPIRGDHPVAYAFFGDAGPYLVGLEQDADGVWSPSLFDDRGW